MTEPIRCTYCGGDKFYEGPSGGTSTNILCANEDCRHWFNSCPGGLDDLDRVEPTDEEKEATRAEKKSAAEKMDDAFYQEGRTLFEAGKSSRECLRKPDYNSPPLENLLRLSGWMDAAHDSGKSRIENVRDNMGSSYALRFPQGVPN